MALAPPNKAMPMGSVWTDQVPMQPATPDEYLIRAKELLAQEMRNYRPGPTPVGVLTFRLGSTASAINQLSVHKTVDGHYAVLGIIGTEPFALKDESGAFPSDELVAKLKILGG